MISGATNSEAILAVLWLPGVILGKAKITDFNVFPRAGCTIRMLGGCQAESGVAEHTLRKESSGLPGLGRTLRGPEELSAGG